MPNWCKPKWPDTESGEEKRLDGNSKGKGEPKKVCEWRKTEACGWEPIGMSLKGNVSVVLVLPKYMLYE